MGSPVSILLAQTLYLHFIIDLTSCAFSYSIGFFLELNSNNVFSEALNCNTWLHLGFREHCKCNLELCDSPATSQQFWTGGSPPPHMSCGVHCGQLEEYGTRSSKKGRIRMWNSMGNSNLHAFKETRAVSLGAVKQIELKKIYGLAREYCETKIFFPALLNDSFSAMHLLMA